jgi:hypothetical protein
LLGFEARNHESGIYIDGHEREDVVAYRNKWALEMKAYRKMMQEYDGVDMHPIMRPNGKAPLVLVTHDESVAHALDQSRGRVERGTRCLKKKNRGRGLHCSAFVCECHGLMELSSEQAAAAGIPDNERKALVYLEIGKNNQGYWTNAKLVAQMPRVFAIFNALHPGQQALMAFDNSANHHKGSPTDWMRL